MKGHQPWSMLQSVGRCPISFPPHWQWDWVIPSQWCTSFWPWLWTSSSPRLWAQLTLWSSSQRSNPVSSPTDPIVHAHSGPLWGPREDNSSCEHRRKTTVIFFRNKSIPLNMTSRINYPRVNLQRSSSGPSSVRNKTHRKIQLKILWPRAGTS